MSNSSTWCIFEVEAITWSPLPFIFSMARVADFNSLALLIQYSNIANILKCKGFGTESNERYGNRACNQLFVLFTCETREAERTEDLS